MRCLLLVYIHHPFMPWHFIHVDSRTRQLDLRRVITTSSLEVTECSRISTHMLVYMADAHCRRSQDDVWRTSGSISPLYHLLLITYIFIYVTMSTNWGSKPLHSIIDSFDRVLFFSHTPSLSKSREDFSILPSRDPQLGLARATGWAQFNCFCMWSHVQQEDLHGHYIVIILFSTFFLPGEQSSCENSLFPQYLITSVMVRCLMLSHRTVYSVKVYSGKKM